MTTNTNNSQIQTIERLFNAGYDIDTLRWYEGFEDWYQARLEEASAPADLEEEAPKTTGQKIKETLLAMIAGALITLLIATAPAEAMPRKFKAAYQAAKEKDDATTAAIKDPTVTEEAFDAILEEYDAALEELARAITEGTGGAVTPEDADRLARFRFDRIGALVARLDPAA